MKPLYLAAGALTAALALAACGQKTETAAEAPAAPAPAATPAAPAADSMPGMKMDAAKMAKGTGTVKAVDAAAGAVTLDHGPIPEANWPAMTMGFKAAPALLQGVKVGDQVAFDLKLENGSGEITAIQKQ